MGAASGANLTPTPGTDSVLWDKRFLELTQFMYSGSGYTAGLNQTFPGTPLEHIENSLTGYTVGGFKGNGVVSAAMLTRMRVFSQLRFLFQEVNNGRPGNFVNTRGLLPLHRPWPNGTTRDLLTRMIVHADLAGNAYVARPKIKGTNQPGPYLMMLRPDWVGVGVGGDPEDPGSQLVGYVYQPGGPGSGAEPIVYGPDEVAHFAPIPDPTAVWRGMSWLTPVVRNIQAHQQATTHKISFLEKGATPNLIVKFDPQVSQEAIKVFKAMFEESQTGAANAFKTLFLGGGADATVVGSKLSEMAFAETQDAEEAIIAANAGVPLAILQLGEGLQGSTLNAGNIEAVKRVFQETTIADLGTAAAGALATIVSPPNESTRLWYDVRDVPFFRSDADTAANVRQTDAATIRTLVDGGYDPPSVVAAVMADDFSLLQHSGLLSVQLQEPGTANGGDMIPQEGPNDDDE